MTTAATPSAPDKSQSDLSAQNGPALTGQLFPIGSLPPGDRLLDQWYLYNTGQNGGLLGADINVVPVWDDWTGAGVTVAVYDSGVEVSHPDLAANYDASQELSRTVWFPDGVLVELNNAGCEAFDFHGTAVAGIIAAANNGVGTRGVAYDAHIVSVDIFDQQSGSPNAIPGTYVPALWTPQQFRFDVVNHSWTAGIFQTDPDSLQMRADTEYAAVAGRNGLGTVVVVAAANNKTSGGEANAELLASERHAITVAALLNDGTVTAYSNPGASVLVSAFGGPFAAGPTTEGNPADILTTDRTDTIDGIANDGYNINGTTFYFDGTSAAAPQVSGIAALMLQANPNLGWRDVKEILALSARHTGSPIGAGPVAPEEGTWVYNQADNWNGGGMHFSNDYGFGMVDALAAVRLAESWTTASTSANEDHVSTNISQVISIPDAINYVPVIVPGVATTTIPLYNNLQIETVTLHLTGSHTFMGDLRIELISPRGTHSVVLDQAGTSADFPSAGWTVSSNAFLGEMSGGTWTVTISDMAPGDVGTITSIELSAYGKDWDSSLNDTYYFTNEFAAVADDGVHGFIAMDEDGGIDTINAAAVTTDTIIDLNGSYHYKIAGREGFGGWASNRPDLYVIENIIGGDGNDQLGGNFADNDIRGMRGDDTLRGYDGRDILDGGSGNDVLAGGPGDDILRGGTGNDFFFIEGDTDVVIENMNEGIDHVFYTDAANVRVLADNVEYGWSLGSTPGVTGNALDNVLIGGYATVAQTLSGGDGNDFISGTPAADVLVGGDGNDIILGRGGGDQMTGGDGNDSYYVESLSDVVNETSLAAAGTADVVFTNVNTTLAANVEYLFTFGDATSVVGSSGDNYILGVYSAHAVNLDGGDGHDLIIGSNFADTLIGGDGNDTMFGAAGGADGFADVMRGGNGNDAYFLSEAIDTAFEDADQGADVVYAAFNYSLAADFETLFIYGAATIGTGNDDDNAVIGSYIATGATLAGAGGNDIVIGGAGDDSIIGGTGVDSLTGSAGNDVFIFNMGEAEGDTITDFSGNGVAAGDEIRLVGYGAGATFTQVDATHWQVSYGPDLAIHETIGFQNGAPVHPGDVVFV